MKTEIEGTLSPSTLHSATPAHTEAAGSALRVAIIYPPPSQWQWSDDQFRRDLAYNRGRLPKLFDTATESVQSLRQIFGSDKKPSQFAKRKADGDD
jgi:hypothetical protein